ncbi:MAG: EAL domain-containing protein [Alphaproteobacteria bacterium]|nr:EAL domain-containing protein [Alphaproteobacteria bacterium]
MGTAVGSVPVGMARRHRAERIGVEAKRVRCGREVDQVEHQPSSEARTLASEAMLRAAVRQDRFLFAFQPVVCAATGSVDYFECLLRMRDEHGTLIAGVEFISIIEALGLIGVIDHHVLEKTVEELVAHPQVSLGLNVSGLTVCNPTWLQSLIALLRHRSEIARRLVVEITETAALSDMADSARVVTILRQIGCRVALDDFGAGHTSLRHLEVLPLDIVKIDGSIIRNLTNSRQNLGLLRHLLGHTKDFGFATVAEWVENEDDAELLRAEGIGYLQGYHVGRPTFERSRLATAETTVR